MYLENVLYSITVSYHNIIEYFCYTPPDVIYGQGDYKMFPSLDSINLENIESIPESISKFVADKNKSKTPKLK